MPQASQDSFNRFVRAHLASKAPEKLTDERLAKLYTDYGPGAYDLPDQGYIAKVHPLDLWLLGYLLNQHMLLPDDVITGVDYDEELAVVVVRTKRKTNYEKKLKKKVQTCFLEKRHLILEI